MLQALFSSFIPFLDKRPCTQAAEVAVPKACTDAVHPLHHDIRDNWQKTGSTGGLTQLDSTMFPQNISMTHWASPAPGLLPAADAAAIGKDTGLVCNQTQNQKSVKGKGVFVFRVARRVLSLLRQERGTAAVPSLAPSSHDVCTSLLVSAASWNLPAHSPAGRRLQGTQQGRRGREEAKRCGCCGFSSHSTSLLRNWTRGLVCGWGGERKGPWIRSLPGSLSQPRRDSSNADGGLRKRRENQPPNQPRSSSSWCINIHCRARGVNSLLSPQSLPFMPFISHRCHYCLMSTPPSQPLKWT
ncbi:uncharacterized protein LOC141928191 isoform X1 [Strix aluco]|uniref:uncharacterized protein LOC141928191 isoform X1 n=1 Tax=Strix aluco TaxID=111821 RepID=UPI003DA477B1